MRMQAFKFMADLDGAGRPLDFSSKQSHL
jgi:hypothetical protein